MVEEQRKRQRTSIEREERNDRLSDLPDLVLLHVLKFMDTKDVFRTSVLSKRWKNLWKFLTTLSFSRKDFKRIRRYNKYVNQILSGRDDSISLFNLKLDAHGVTSHKLLDTAIQYAGLHDVQELTINLSFDIRYTPSSCFGPLDFSCQIQSLTFLKLSLHFTDCYLKLKLPKSLDLPNLKSLHLEGVNFTGSDNNNDIAEPFSTCYSLNTLDIKDYSLYRGPKVLSICNANLSTLKLEGAHNCVFHPYNYQPKIVLSTPNLVSMSFRESMVNIYHQLSSMCDLSCLEEVKIDAGFSLRSSVIVNWLRVFSNVKILTLSTLTLNVILHDISYLAEMKIQPPRFVRLESLRIQMYLISKISDEGVKKTLEYLLQNTSPLTRVAVINC